MQLTPTDLLNRLQELTRLQYIEQPTPRFAAPTQSDEFSIPVDLAYIENLIITVSRRSVSELTLYESDNCELLVREESASPFYGRGPLKSEDPELGIEYEVSPASDHYIVFLVEQLAETGVARNYLRPRMPFNMIRDRLGAQEGGFSIFDYLRRAGLRYPTIKIKSRTKKSLSDYRELTNAFTFQAAFNLDIALVPQRTVLDFARGARLALFRRARTEQIDPPRRRYVHDLVYHYQMGLSAESPFVAFLSYYHIAEHYFENIFNDDLIEAIKQKITLPSFSYRRKKDIQGLIADVKKAFQFKAESETYNEQEALRLTLKKYVPIGPLGSTLKQFDEPLFNYIKTDEVTFSKGPAVPWDSPDPDMIYKQLARRIYLTRNALVHSKESEKARYTPFSDDSVLNMEIPLMRFIAESIITETSQIPN